MSDMCCIGTVSRAAAAANVEAIIHSSSFHEISVSQRALMPLSPLNTTRQPLRSATIDSEQSAPTILPNQIVTFVFEDFLFILIILSQ
jgi:hypothetical protein